MSLSIGSTTSIVFKTLPYIFLRLLVYTFFGILFLFYLGCVWMVGEAVHTLHEHARTITWAIGLMLSFPIWRFAREYLLYLVKAGHVAVITELATKGSLPAGVSQIQWGKDAVQARFKQASVLFLFDGLVRGTISAINRMMQQMGQMFSALPGTQGLVKLANGILYFSLTYVDEAILARNFAQKNETIWQSGKTGVVLYAQAWKQILTTAIVSGLGSFLFLPIALVLLLIPAFGIGHMWPEAKVIAIAAAIIFSFILKAALLDPWTLTAMILTYLKSTEGMAVNPDWERKIEAVSSKFKKLQEKATAAIPA